MDAGLKIIGSDIIFKNPKTMGLIGVQRNFTLPLSDVVTVGYITAWFGGDEAEILVIIDRHSNEFDVNMGYIDESFYETLAHYTGVNFSEKLNELEGVWDKSAILYSKNGSPLAGRAMEIKWTAGRLIKSVLNILSSRSPVSGFLKTT